MLPREDAIEVARWLASDDLELQEDAQLWLEPVLGECALRALTPGFPTTVGAGERAQVFGDLNAQAALLMKAGVPREHAERCVYGWVRALSIGGYGAAERSRSSFPESLVRFYRTEDISLYNNHFTHLPEELRQFPCLKRIDAQINRLESLPDWLGELPPGVTLLLGGNIPLTTDARARAEAERQLARQRSVTAIWDYVG